MSDQQISQTVTEVPQSVEDSSSGVNEPLLDIESYEPPPDDPNGGAFAPPPGGLNTRLIIVSLLGIIILAGVIFGIYSFINGNKNNTGNGEVTLTYWGLWESEEVMQATITDFEQKNPGIHVIYEMNAPIQYRERLQASIERGEGPDVFRFHNSWLPMIKNNLEPVPDSVMSLKDANEQYYPGIVNDLSQKDSMIGLPFGFDMLMLYYNKDIFDGEGVTVPTTWEEFDTVADALTQKDKGGTITRSGAAIGTAENIDHFSDILGLLFYQNGVRFPELTSNAAIQTLEFYTLFALPPNNVWDEKQDNSILAFSAGKVAMIFAPSWQVHAIKALNPNLQFATASVPQLAGGTPITWSSYWAEGVSSASNQKEAAFKFIKYLSEKDTMTRLYTDASKLESRLFGEPYPRIDLKQELVSSEYIAPLADQAPFMRSWYLSSNTYDNGLNDKIINYFRDAVNAVLQGSSAEGAIETATSGVSQVLVEYDAVK